MPSMHTALLIRLPITKVIPLVFSIKSVNTAATSNTTIVIVLNSVLRNSAAPLRIIPAISAISAVPSSIFLILK